MSSTISAVPDPATHIVSSFDDEPSLLAYLRAGDEDAYEHLFRTHVGSMMTVARRFLGDTDDAADAVQAAFVSAFRGVTGFEGTSRLGTWLHRITVNACLMKLRARRRSRTVPFDDHFVDVPDRSLSAGDDLGRHETTRCVRACIDRLPADYRTVILLRDLEGFDTAATANRLGVTENVVKTRLHRARHALRPLLESLIEL